MIKQIDITAGAREEIRSVPALLAAIDGVEVAETQGCSGLVFRGPTLPLGVTVVTIRDCGFYGKTEFFPFPSDELRAGSDWRPVEATDAVEYALAAVTGRLIERTAGVRCHLVMHGVHVSLTDAASEEEGPEFRERRRLTLAGEVVTSRGPGDLTFWSAVA